MPRLLPSPSWRNVVLLSLAYVLLLYHAIHPLLRFAWQPLNDLFGFFVLIVLPWVIIVTVLRIRTRTAKWAGALALPPLVFYSIAILFLSLFLFTYHEGHNASFHRFASTPWRGSRVSLYRINGGATTSFGVQIRHERTLLPGFLLVRPVESFYPCSELEALPSMDGVTVSSSGGACAELGSNRSTYPLKPFVYF